MSPSELPHLVHKLTGPAGRDDDVDLNIESESREGFLQILTGQSLVSNLEIAIGATVSNEDEVEPIAWFELLLIDVLQYLLVHVGNLVLGKVFPRSLVTFTEPECGIDSETG